MNTQNASDSLEKTPEAEADFVPEDTITSAAQKPFSPINNGCLETGSLSPTSCFQGASLDSLTSIFP